jgi:hypothetical protein
LRNYINAIFHVKFRKSDEPDKCYLKPYFLLNTRTESATSLQSAVWSFTVKISTTVDSYQQLFLNYSGWLILQNISMHENSIPFRLFSFL